MDYKEVYKQVSQLLSSYYKSDYFTSIASDELVIPSELLSLQEIFVNLSNDRTYMHHLSRNPQNLKVLGIGKCVHLNRIIFRIFVDPILRVISQNGDINNFSKWDHFLFADHLQLLDSPSWFAEAFWDINRHSFGLLNRSKLTALSHQSSQFISGDYNGPIVLVFKGPACNAHFHNLVRFIESIDKLGLSHRFRVVFLDSPSTETPAICCKAFYLNNIPVSEKILSLKSIVTTTKCSCLIWVASVQNLGLYLFSRLAPVQAYWSMKYHSIVCSYIDINFRSSTYADLVTIDNATWHGIPFDFMQSAIPLTTKSDPDISLSLSKAKTKKVNFNHPVRLLTLGREIKVSNPLFSSLIVKLINSHKYTYSYSGRFRTSWHTDVSNQLSFSKRLSFLGWLNMSQMYQVLSKTDIYIDSFPFGGGHTCFYAMAMSVPIMMVNTEQNRRCSFMMHLLDLRTFFGKTNMSLESFGIFESSRCLAEFLINLTTVPQVDASKQITEIAENQSSLFNQWSDGRHIIDQYKSVAAKMLSAGKLLVNTL